MIFFKADSRSPSISTRSSSSSSNTLVDSPIRQFPKADRMTSASSSPKSSWTQILKLPKQQGKQTAAPHETHVYNDTPLTAAGISALQNEGRISRLRSLQTSSVADIVVGALVGVNRGVHADEVRTHGLYYTGIVDSKKLSRQITHAIMGINLSNTQTLLQDIFGDKLSQAGLNLTDSQIRDIYAYYLLAMAA